MAPYWLLLLPIAVFAWTALVATIGVAIQAADRNEPIGPTPPVLARIAREAAARGVLLALWPFAWGVARPRPARDPAPDPAVIGDAQRFAGVPQPERARLPVVLVPGLTWNRASFWPLATFLRRRGWRWVHPIDRGGRGSTLAAEAEALAGAIRELCAASGAARVDLVGFSTGGLVAAWYLRHHGADRVRHLITLGTAWQGTRMAVFGRGRASDELRFGSHVLDGLWPPPVPTVCVFSPDDPVVVPAASAVPPERADTVSVDACGHVEMLLSARVYRAVQTALDHPVPEAGQAGVRAEATSVAATASAAAAALGGASANGSTLVPPPMRDPTRTSS